MYLPSLKQKIAETVGRLEDDPWPFGKAGLFFRGQLLLLGRVMNFFNYNQMIIRQKIFKCDIYIYVCFHAVVYMMQHIYEQSLFRKKTTRLVFILQKGSGLESPD